MNPGGFFLPHTVKARLRAPNAFVIPVWSSFLAFGVLWHQRHHIEIYCLPSLFKTSILIIHLPCSSASSLRWRSLCWSHPSSRANNLPDHAKAVPPQQQGPPRGRQTLPRLLKHAHRSAACYPRMRVLARLVSPLYLMQCLGH
jgi:hypothetical protein